MSLALRFLGTGNAHAVALGNAAAVLERDASPVLLIDCGPDVPGRYLEQYDGALPRALFLTHLHMDHVGGLEALFYRAWFNPAPDGLIRVFVPAPLVPALHQRVGEYPNALAEGGANFWDGFQLVPVGEQFWWDGLRFEVFPVRHHQVGTAFGLGLSGHFLYTGDTRPIPEVLNRHGSQGERIFHDCALQGNPSHTGLADLAGSYGPEQRARMVLYHHESAAAAQTIREAGYAVAAPGDCYALRDHRAATAAE